MTEQPTDKRPVWMSENTHPTLSSQLKEALREVKDPELGLDIIQLGLVRNVSIDDEKANIQMILTTPFCPYGPAIMEMTRKASEDFLKRSTTIEMGIEAWDMSMLEEGLADDDWGLLY
jgi:metal-sulfur cluster biosynthetic enzyme